MKKTCFLFSLFITLYGVAQDNDKVNKKAVKRLRSDLTILASDQMKGREPGTMGEIKARDYISERMKDIGLEPKGSNGFVQAFPYFENVKQEANQTKLSLNNKPMKLYQDFYPVSLSSNGMLSDVPVISVLNGIHSPNFSYSDYDNLDIDVNGYIVQLDLYTPSTIDFEVPDLVSRVIEARDRGAVALLLYSSQKEFQLPAINFKRIQSIGIPVLVLRNSIFTKVPANFIENATLSVSQYEVTEMAHNVIGFIDNDAETTVVISGHYDHLGYGGEGSMYKGPRKIHNGADDNASGTAGVLELAHYFKNNKITEQNNFLFIAFSAEEKGLLGSKYFVKNPILALAQFNFVINMDMIGRMEQDMPLTIEGLGSSLVWEPSIKGLAWQTFPLTLKSREDGPSDHAPFYAVGIPALHFWTGKHDDYHKPSDDVEKINFEAESKIISFIEMFVMSMDEKGKVGFQKRENK